MLPVPMIGEYPQRTIINGTGVWIMGAIPGRAAERIRDSIKKFQPILSSAKARDVNESDTVVIVTDLLQYVFGYDKYTEITSEHAIRGTYCDLAVKIDGALAFLLEVKAIGLELKDNHVKQAVDYAANQGVEWVGLTNGCTWRIYNVLFTKPIQHECILEFDFLNLSHRNADHIELLGMLAKEGWTKSKITEYKEQREALSKFTVGALLLSEPMTQVLRRELRKVVGVLVGADEIRDVLQNEVIKRDVLEGEKAQVAARLVARAARRANAKEKDVSKGVEGIIDDQPAEISSDN